MTQQYRRLRAERILDYVTRLSMRVTERFPNHGLAPRLPEIATDDGVGGWASVRSKDYPPDYRARFGRR